MSPRSCTVTLACAQAAGIRTLLPYTAIYSRLPQGQKTRRVRSVRLLVAFCRRSNNMCCFYRLFSGFVLWLVAFQIFYCQHDTQEWTRHSIKAAYLPFHFKARQHLRYCRTWGGGKKKKNHHSDTYQTWSDTSARHTWGLCFKPARTKLLWHNLSRIFAQFF